MSKSEVNLSKKFCVSRLKSESALSTLEASKARGRELNFERCHKPCSTIDTAKYKPKKIKPSNLYVCKLEYPPENVYPSCDHQNDFVIDRSTFTSDEYLKFLSTPKKHYEKPLPRWVSRNIPPCTAHLNTLSQPKKTNLINTLNEHRYHLTFDRIENLINKIKFGDRQTPQEVVESLRQRLRCSKNKIRQQKCEIRRLRMKIEKSKKFNDVSSKLVSKIRETLFCDCPISDDCQQLAKLILPKLCEITGHQVPKENSSNTLDKAYIALSEKFAVAVSDYLKNVCESKKSEALSDCMKKFNNLCLPIEDFYPREFIDVSNLKEESIDQSGEEEEEEELEKISQESHDEEENENDDETEETIIASENIQSLSFLRQSQIKISPEDCQRVMTVFDEMTAKLAEKKSQKGEQKAARAEREKAFAQERAEKEAQQKAEEKALKKARRKKGKSCFGNTAPKPMWQVEWQGAEKNPLCDKKSDSP